MSATLISLIARVLSWFPLRAIQALGAGFGWLLFLTNSKPKHITQSNLRLCYPELSEAELKTLTRLSLIEAGKQTLECPWIWHRPVDQTRQLIDWGDTRAQLDNALNDSRGTIVISPHIGNWEVCTLALSERHPFTYFYRNPRKAAIGELLVAWRAHIGGRGASLDSKGIRLGLKTLKSGECLGILPDQEPDLDHGLFADFLKIQL